MRRPATVLIVIALALACATPAWATAATPVVIEGVGAAHGFGMAMDGVEGQARAGWSHERILDLFYPGTETGRAGGTIRVGLATVPAVTIGLPHGGSLSDAPRGAQALTPGFPRTIAPGGSVSVRADGDGLAFSPPDAAPPRPAATAGPAQETGRLIPTPPPDPETPEEAPRLLEPTPTPAPRKTPGETTAPPAGDGPRIRSLWLWGTGSPALVSVDATGRRYRGVMEVRARGGSVVVVNHVDLETYTAGIAEEKGQAWPIEGLKSLAIAARTLGAATMSWYTKNQPNGYDICPTGACQLYLGYDGEEPAMQRAVTETAGQIRTFRGRPILAMYHGNGGGHTESYKKVIDNGTDPHPYLSAVKYPFADPSQWERRTTLADIENALRAAEIAVPAGLRRVEVAERGESPRVTRVELEGTSGETDIAGTRFAEALELPSTWFEFGAGTVGSSTVTRGSALLAAAPPAFGVSPGVPSGRGGWWPAVVAAAAALGLLVPALRLRARGLPR